MAEKQGKLDEGPVMERQIEARFEEERRDVPTQIAEELKSLRELLGKSKFTNKDHDIFDLIRDKKLLLLEKLLGRLPEWRWGYGGTDSNALSRILDDSRINLRGDKEIYMFTPDAALMRSRGYSRDRLAMIDEYEILLATDQDDEIAKRLTEERGKLQESLDRISEILA